MDNRLLKIYTRLLEIHIATKTTNSPFHRDTETAYNTAFDCLHLIAEMKQDLQMDNSLTCEEVAQETYNLVEEIKDILKENIDWDIWMDNLVRWLYQDVNSICWTLRGYVKEEKEEGYEEEQEEPKEIKKEIARIKIPR